MTSKHVVCGVLDLSFGAARAIINHSRIATTITVVCRRYTYPALLYLRLCLRDRLKLQILERDPYNLSAQHLCDSQQRNFRCDAIESVISAAGAAVVGASAEIGAILQSLALTNSADIARKFLRHQAGETFKNHVYLGYHLLTVSRQEGSPQNAVLIIPQAWWFENVRGVFKDIKLSVVGYSVGVRFGDVGFGNLLRRLFRQVKANGYLDRQPGRSDVDMDCGCIECSNLRARNSVWNGVRVSGTAFDGLDASLRNNVGWAWCCDLPLDAFVFFWAVISRRPTNWEMVLGQYGPHIVNITPDAVAGQFSEFHMRPAGRLRRTWRLMLANLLMIIKWRAALTTRRRKWVSTNIALLLSRTHDWTDILDQMNIRVHVEFDYGVEAYARALAIRRLGGVVVLDQRSQYYDNYDHTSDRPGDLAFVSGPNGLRYYSPRCFEVPDIVMTGLGSDGGGAVPLGLLEKTSLALPRVAVFDEPGTLYGPEHALQFIASLIEHCFQNGCYRIIFKPKKWQNLVRKLPAHIVQMLDSLVAMGKCDVLPSEVSVHRVCQISDLVVSVPSTAAYIAIGAGKPTLVFNPFHTIRTVFYEQGLSGRCIFDQIGDLLASVSVFVASRSFDEAMCKELRKALDPWLDMSGNRRKGYLLSVLVDRLSLGDDREIAIKEALSAYRDMYGKNTCGNWDEVWAGCGGSESGLMVQPPRYDKVD